MIAWFVFITALIIIFGSATVAPTTIVGRSLSLLAVMLGATIIVTGSMRLVPGDPIDHILGDQAFDTSRTRLAYSLGLVDENGESLNFVEQYSNFLGSLAQGNIESYVSRRNAIEMVLERLPYTVMLSICAMLVAMMLGPVFGVLASFFRHRWQDHAFSVFALVGISLPSFFLGPLLLIVFALRLRLLPISGADDGIYSLVLPSLTMGTALAAMLARMSRASMLEILSEDFVRTALAKGLSPRVVFFKHALRNALIPVVTVMGLQFGAILAGSVITEKIFNWPGVGLLLLESIQRLDMPVVQATVLVIAFIYAVINMLTDMVYSMIDPRMGAVK